MEKYKICPSCQTKNAPALLECIRCEADLAGVKITDEETQRLQQQQREDQPEPEAKLVRICSCGARNAPNARKCTACREDISDVVPTVEKAQEDITFALSSLDGQYAFLVTKEETTVGREQEMGAYLSAKSYVSRTHAKLFLAEGKLLIENLSNTNFTYVNNQKITGRVELKDGDEIGLGGTNLGGKCQEQAAYFLVRIGSCM